MTGTPETADGSGSPLRQLASTMLTDIGLPDTRPILCLMYNAMPDPPGQPSYAVAPTDPQMWDCAPTVRDALDLLTELALVAPIIRPPGSKPAPIAHIGVDQRAGRRLDGMAILFRAWTLDSDTAAGRAVLANVGEGFYRFGDVAASPQRRDIRSITAVGRDGARAALMRAPDGPVENYPGQPALGGQRAPGGSLKLFGGIPDGLELLLGALHIRFGHTPRAAAGG